MSKPNFKPWRFAGQGILVDDDENEIVLGNVYSDDQVGWLIAAAPDLYAALDAAEALLKLHGYPAFKNSDSIRAQARAALAKAEGR